MAAVVHHGGAGTTAAGLTAGKPSIICPFIADQPFWGRRVEQLGVGPAPIPQGKLSAARLADALKVAVSDAGMRERAAALGDKLRAEDGVANAVGLVKRYAGEPVRTPQP
jgi:sterol 3beta-glucosyltransferase